MKAKERNIQLASKATATNGETSAPTRSESINLNPEQASTALAAWRGLYHLFGGRVENWEVTPDGITATGFSVDGQYDPNTLITDISHRARRLDFLTVYPWINGEVPAEFTDASEITAWAVQFLKGSVEKDNARTPKYFKDAGAAYKATHNLTKRRGPKRKVIRLDDLDNVDPSMFANIDVEELQNFQATVEKALAAKAEQA